MTIHKERGAQPSVAPLKPIDDRAVQPVEDGTSLDVTLQTGTVREKTSGGDADSGNVSQLEDVAAKPADEDGPTRSKGEIAVIMSALCMCVLLAALDITIITTALPTITEHFHSSSGYTWIGSAYLLACAAATPSWGKVSDIFGRKPVILNAVAIFFLGSALCGAATSIQMLIGGRVVQGIGGGGLIVLVQICIADLFSMRSRSAYYGIIGMVWAFASGVGPIMGGVFTEKVTWRWCFYLNLPITGAVFFVILFFLKLTTPRTPLLKGLAAIDWLGSITIIGGTLMFLLGLEFGGVTFPWHSATVISLLAFGVFTLAVLFLIVEWKFAAYPVMPLRIFRRGSNIAALLVCASHGFVFISGSYYLPLYFQAVRGASPLLSGVYVLPFALTLSLVSAVTGIIIKKTGRYLECMYFGLIIMSLGFGLFIDLDAHSSVAKIVLYQMVAGLGTGPLFQTPLLALQAGVAPRDIATATATFGFVRNLATSISVVVGGVIFQNGMKNQLPRLIAALGSQAGHALGGGSAGANVMLVNLLPGPQREIARVAFASALRKIWILYVCIGVAGLVASAFIRRQILAKSHVETKTGLDAHKGDDALQQRARIEEKARPAGEV